jgi:hypothetical protein
LHFRVGDFVDQVWRVKSEDAMNVIVEDDENKTAAGIRIMTSNLPDLGTYIGDGSSVPKPGTNDLDP